jgi:ketosteroid isomerase-like protein
MSNVDTLRQGYEAFGRGDLDAVMELYTEDAQWENPNAQQLPNPGVVRGRDAIRQSFVDFAQLWDQVDVSPDEFIEDGDTVVVLGHIDAKARETGRDVKLPFVHVFRFSDGKASEVQALTDTALAAEALGRL